MAKMPNGMNVKEYHAALVAQAVKQGDNLNRNQVAAMVHQAFDLGYQTGNAHSATASGRFGELINALVGEAIATPAKKRTAKKAVKRAK